MSDVMNLGFGTCDISYDGTDVGHTQGDVELGYEPDVHESKVNKFGSTTVRTWLKGEKVTLKVPLAESTVANLGIAIPGGTVVQGGTASRLNVGGVAGRELAGAELIATPVVDPLNQVVLHKAVSKNQVTVGYSNEGDRIIEVEFEGILDEAKAADGNGLFSIGDQSTA